MHVVLLSIPGLRERDLALMPCLAALAKDGEVATLKSSFPAVTCPVQANMTTGCLPREHGVVANGFFWRDRGEVEMWTAWNECIQRPQLWDLLHERDPSLTSAVWFPMHSKGCGADYICTPAPIHNPDGSESLWCYTRPEGMYGDLRDALGHFPLQHFWGPLAGIQSSAWIVNSALWAADRYKPKLFYIYLPHLDYAAQKFGPDSPQAIESLSQLDAVISNLVEGLETAYSNRPNWIVASEYAIVPVDHVTYPNRVLREAGLLILREEDGREYLNVTKSPAWALVDHQFSHVFIHDRDAATISKVAELFRDREGIAETLVGDERGKYALDHERSGDIILISSLNSWQAYYWWLEDAKAPTFAHTVDIHRKPGYDPVELFFDPVKKGIPLDATLVKGSHGAPVERDDQRGIVLTSHKSVLGSNHVTDTSIAEIVLRQFGL